jgi:hypothetical protein
MTTNTTFVDIYDLFLQLVEDYKLTALYNDDVANSTTNLDTLLESWLMLSIPDFENICDQDLEDRTDSTATFNFEMTVTNKTILAQIMVKYWLSKAVHDIRQMNLHVQDRDFKTFAEANNLTAKSNELTKIEEKISQRLVDYGYADKDMWEYWITNGFTTLQP